MSASHVYSTIPEQSAENILISKRTIKRKVAQLAADINRQYKNKNNIVFLCVLNGAFVFFADLIRLIEVPHIIGFIGVSGYGPGVSVRQDNTHLVMPMNVDIAGKNVIVIEDIIDTGKTILALHDILKTHSPKSVYYCVLLSKPDNYDPEELKQHGVELKSIGFHIPSKYVYGYGLDWDHHQRNAPYIAIAAITGTTTKTERH